MKTTKEYPKYTLFISYSSQDEELVIKPIVNTLESIIEITPFVASFDPRPTYLREKIVPQLESCWAILAS